MIFQLDTDYMRSWQSTANHGSNRGALGALLLPAEITATDEFCRRESHHLHFYTQIYAHQSPIDNSKPWSHRRPWLKLVVHKEK